MKPLREANLATLRWVQPRFRKWEYNLTSGDDLIGTLRWKGFVGPLATGETTDGSWIFNVVGHWHEEITISEVGSDTNLYTIPLTGRTKNPEISLQFPDGRLFRWRQFGFIWGDQWELIGPHNKGVAIIRFDRWTFLKSFVWGRKNASVEIEQSSISSIPVISLLLLLGWYVTMVPVPSEDW